MFFFGSHFLDTRQMAQIGIVKMSCKDLETIRVSEPNGQAFHIQISTAFHIIQIQWDPLVIGLV